MVLLSFVLCLIVGQNPGRGRLIGLAGVFYWGYHTLDNVDGSHARRTGTSGPAGEFLDHGIDAIVCSLPALGVAFALGLPPALILIATSIIALSFWATLWSMYHTGVFTLRPVSDSEAAVAATLVLFAGGIVGREPLILVWGPAGISIASLLGLAVILGFGWQLCVSVARPKSTASRLPVIPIVASHVLFITWYFLAKGAVSIAAIGLLLALVSGHAGQRILLARLLGQPVPNVNWLTLVLLCLGPVMLLVRARVAQMQAVLAWSLVAVVGTIQVVTFVTSWIALRKQQDERVLNAH